MKDTEILDWISMFVLNIERINGKYIILWRHKDIARETKGISLRDAVLGAKIQKDNMCK